MHSRCARVKVEGVCSTFDKVTRKFPFGQWNIFRIFTSGSLEISNLALSDAGKYHCHVTSHGKTKVRRHVYH